MIYHIEPVLEAFVWGGRKIIDAYHLKTDLPNVGQIYHVIGLRGHQDCMVTEAGEPLSYFYEHHPELFACNAPVFPLRLATSCAEKKMSYHLHPNNDYAFANVGTMGKVSGSVPLEPDGSVRTHLFGNKATSLEEFKELVEKQDWDNLFSTIQVRSGQFLHTPAGVIHGGKSGGKMSIVFATNSDISYRFFDYNRNDPNRKLHLQQVYDCVNIPEVPLGAIDPISHQDGDITITDYYATPGEYVARRLDVAGCGNYELEQFYCLTCVKGEGSIEGTPIQLGQTLLVPAGSGPISLKGNMQLYLISYLNL